MPIDLYPLLRPFLFQMDPEKAHGLAIRALKAGLAPKISMPEDAVLKTRVFGLDFTNPIGLAAGFDKQADVIEEIARFGFAFREIGGVVPLPQPGNPQPRMFRIPESQAVINRFNFNSIGFDAFGDKLRRWHETKRKAGDIVGVNIAKGDHHEDAAEAYVAGLKKFAPYADFVTVNVSCPNEPDARNLEGREQLHDLLERVMAAHSTLTVKPRLLVKISPDQTEKQAQDIAEVALGAGIDGMIVGNTTATRPASVTSPIARERGGLSGRPLFAPSTAMLGKMYKLTGGKIPIIGCGGIFTGADAYAKIRAGASLLQLYTSMVYEGPFVVRRIVTELAALLKRDGFASVADAVGADFK